MEDKIVVDLHHIYFSYDDIPVLDDINITVEQYDFLSIIGPNGGGKTTILKIILGLLEPNKGTVTVFGTSPKRARKYVGYVPQYLTFDFEFPINVMDVVLMGRLGKRGIGKRYSKDDIDAANRALKKVGMEDYKNRQIGDLSGGQRQRVFIARALSSEPKLLLLDEPVTGVDTTWQLNFYELLRDLNKEITIIMVTHDVGIVSAYIDKIACINKKLYYHGSKKDGFSKLKEMRECPVHLTTHEEFRMRLRENL